METPAVDPKTLDDIVIHWEQEYNDYLADIKTRRTKGNATTEEIGELENLERIVLLYDLMMKSVIEQKGFWSNEGRPAAVEKTLNILLDRICPSVDAPREMLYTTIGHALEQGNLRCTDLNGHVRWQWVDYIERTKDD